MMKLKRIKLISLALASLLLFCSCTVKEDIPELKEPVGSAPTYRPVERVNLGKPKLIIGFISGTDYSHFFEKNVTLKKVNVELGQYVEEGTVLFEADTDSVKNQIAQINADITYLDDQHELSLKEYELNTQMHELVKEETEYSKNKGEASESDVKTAENNIKALEENHQYDEEMYEFTKRKYNENLADLNKIASEGVVKAKKSGYVTYIKDLSKSKKVLMDENIVTVTDMEDTYITCNVSTQSYQYSKYDVKAALVNGEMVPIMEYEYSDSETAYTKVKNLYPSVRFKTEEPLDMEVGESIVLVFYLKDKTNTLAIAKEAYQTDDQGTFVYVRNENGVDEKRYFTCGDSDEHYIEVTEGLEEGEMILYANESTLPTMEKQYEVTLKDFVEYDGGKGVKYMEKSTTAYVTEDKGVVDEIYVDPLDEVKKGDKLMRIEIDAEKGKLVEIENKITKENTEYDSFIKDHEEKIEDLKKKYTKIDTDLKQSQSELDEVKKQLNSDGADQLSLAKQKAELEDAVNRCTFGLKENEIKRDLDENEKERRKKDHDYLIATYNRNLAIAKKDNDGTGYKTIYAEEDSKVAKIDVAVGEKVDEGKRLMECDVYFDDMVKIDGFGPLSTGSNVELTVDDNNTPCHYQATVVAGNSNPNSNIFTENGKVKSTAPDPKPNAILKVEEDFFDWSAQFKTLSVSYESKRISNMLNIPSDFLFEETSFDGKKYFYVWVMNGEEYYKKYVLIGTDYELGTKNDPVIINGLSVGDILVK